jgi:hypothetical protein
MKLKAGNRFIFLLIFFLAGCAINHEVHWGDWGPWKPGKDTEQTEVRELSVKSEPDNALVYVDGVFMGETPLSINLQYPVRLEERKRNKYQRVKSNRTFSYTIFGKGPKPGETSFIGAQEETRLVVKEAYHHLELKEKGYVTVSKTINSDDRSVFLSLQKKRCIYFVDFKVEKSIRLIVTEWLQDLIFSNNFSRKISLERLKRVFMEGQEYTNMFEFSEDPEECYSLSCLLIIEKDYSILKTKLTDSEGAVIFNDSERFKTGRETEGFVGNLESAITAESIKIYRMLNK